MSRLIFLLHSTTFSTVTALDASGKVFDDCSDGFHLARQLMELYLAHFTAVVRPDSNRCGLNLPPTVRYYRFDAVAILGSQGSCLEKETAQPAEAEVSQLNSGMICSVSLVS